MKTKKLLSALAAAVMCFIFILPAFSYAGDSSYKEWKQGDQRWGSLSVGNNGTMSSWGCKITALAILMVHSGAEPDDVSQFNPGILRNRYNNAGYIACTDTIATDGNLSASATTKSFSPDFYLSEKVNVIPTPFEDIYDIIETKLSEGYYIEVRVNYNGHSVAVDYCSNGTVYIMDPGSKDISTLNEYDGTIYYVNCYTATENYNAATPDYGVEDYMFNYEFYKLKYPEIAQKYSNNDSLMYNYWITTGISEGQAASAFFDPAYYLNKNADIKARFGNDYEAAYKHFLHYGCNESGRKLSPVYDSDYYAQYDQFEGYSAIELLRHFMNNGIYEGKRASAEFDPVYYRENNPDLNALYGSDYKQYFWHYLIYGASDGSIGFDYESETTPGDIDGDGCIDSSDASLVLSAYAAIATGSVHALDAVQCYAADIDRDDTIDSSDASKILTYYAYTATGGQSTPEEFFGY